MILADPKSQRALELARVPMSATKKTAKSAKAKKESLEIQVEKKLTLWKGGQIAHTILKEQKGARDGDDQLFLFQGRFDAKIYNSIIKKAAEDLGWDQELSFHTQGLRRNRLLRREPSSATRSYERCWICRVA